MTSPKIVRCESCGWFTTDLSGMVRLVHHGDPRSTRWVCKPMPNRDLAGTCLGTAFRRGDEILSALDQLLPVRRRGAR